MNSAFQILFYGLAIIGACWLLDLWWTNELKPNKNKLKFKRIKFYLFCKRKGHDMEETIVLDPLVLTPVFINRCKRCHWYELSKTKGPNMNHKTNEVNMRSTEAILRDANWTLMDTENPMVDFNEIKTDNGMEETLKVLLKKDLIEKIEVLDAAKETIKVTLTTGKSYNGFFERFYGQ